RGHGESLDELAVELEHAPVQSVGRADGAVVEARHLLEPQRAAAHATEHDPPARGPEVDRGDRAGPRAHRRKAAATPASTGMCKPVVCASSGPVSTATAFATCSGSTSRFSRVRWA